MNETREQILGLIELQELSAVDIATELNLSPGAVRRHLDLLVADDLVTSHVPTRPSDTAPVSYTHLTLPTNREV